MSTAAPSSPPALLSPPVTSTGRTVGLPGCGQRGTPHTTTTGALGDLSPMGEPQRAICYDVSNPPHGETTGEFGVFFYFVELNEKVKYLSNQASKSRPVFTCMSSEKYFFELMLETEEERYRSTWNLDIKHEVVKNLMDNTARFSLQLCAAVEHLSYQCEHSQIS